MLRFVNATCFVAFLMGAFMTCTNGQATAELVLVGLWVACNVRVTFGQKAVR